MLQCGLVYVLFSCYDGLKEIPIYRSKEKEYQVSSGDEKTAVERDFLSFFLITVKETSKQT